MYTAFASVYDRLMADVDYRTWAEFYRYLMERYGIHGGKVCECACGTGSLTIPLARMGYIMTGVDLSAEMLFEASQKARRDGVAIPFVKQDMRGLRLHRQMDSVLCTNDGLNYLKTDEEMGDFFTSAFSCLREGGGLFIDYSTPYKLENVLGDHFIGDETEDIAYLWQNRLDRRHGHVDLHLAIFVRQKDDTYVRIEESQRQYMHDPDSVMSLMQAAGFTDTAVFADKKPNGPSPRELRVFIAARKPYADETAPSADRFSGLTF